MRGYGLNEVLDPDRLLAMFLESENDRFLKRFSESTRKLEETIERTNRVVFDKINKIEEATKSMQENLDCSMASLSEYSISESQEDSVLLRMEKKIDELLKFITMSKNK